MCRCGIDRANSEVLRSILGFRLQNGK